MIVVLSVAAKADLEDIGDRIAQDSPRRAESFVEEVYDCCLRLAGAPKAFPLLPRYEAAGLRRRVHGNYLIFYRVEADRIFIVRVLHGAMDYERLLFPKV